MYEGISLQIKPKDRIGLIGANGTGKSTLLKIINGELKPDEGNVAKANNCSIGFLNQDLLSFQSDKSILEVVLEIFTEQNKLQEDIDRLIIKLENEYSEDLVHQLSILQEKFEALDGYMLKSKAEEVLEGLGFETKDLQRPLQEFSGGWRMRVMLARLLLQKPSLLMLDEPTNHLDLPSIEWIEEYLQTYDGAIIIVSHDRRFLDTIAKTIVEISGKKLNYYSGNYTFYLQEKAQRQEIQKSSFENQQQKIRQTERFIERFRAKASKARQVQSRVKALERMELVEDVLDENLTVNFKFNFSKPSGKVVFKMEGVSKNYNSLVVLKKTEALVEKGDKIALIGANGKGKSTLLRIIAGTETVNGKVENGYNVLLSFYAQHQLESLNVENPILDELKQMGSNKTETELRNLLGCFLFTDEDVFKKIKVLSGGEKSRVALAKVLLSEANFLLLDEPTNHLDMQSVNVLVQALLKYQGTYVVVSHDRHFISQIANKIWYIEDQQIKAYPGSYEEYHLWQLEKQNNKASTTVKEKEKITLPDSSQTVQKNNDDKEAKKRLKELNKQLENVENLIFTLEEEKSQLEEQLADPSLFKQAVDFSIVKKKYEQCCQSLENQQKVWDNLVLELQQLR